MTVLGSVKKVSRDGVELNSGCKPLKNSQHLKCCNSADFLYIIIRKCKGFPGSTVVKIHRRHKRKGFNPWAKKIPWRRKWQLTPIFLPGESHGQRSLVG